MFYIQSGSKACFPNEEAAETIDEANLKENLTQTYVFTKCPLFRRTQKLEFVIQILSRLFTGGAAQMPDIEWLFKPQHQTDQFSPYKFFTHFPLLQ